MTVQKFCLHIFVYNCVFWKKEKQQSRNLSHFENESTFLNLMSFLFSEMFMDTSKFSTKTLSAINGLDGAVLRKKDKEYTWRKEMDE